MERGEDSTSACIFPPYFLFLIFVITKHAKKKLINRLAMIMLMAVLPIAFASCSDNEDEPQLPQPEVEGMLVNYSAQIDSAMLKYFDVTVEYTSFDGQTVTVPLNGKQWTQAVAFVREKGEMPSDLDVALKIAKKQSPEFEGKSVRIDGRVDLVSSMVYTDGTVTFLTRGLKTEKRTIAVDKLDDYIDSKNGVIVHYEVSGITYDENGEVVSPIL